MGKGEPLGQMVIELGLDDSSFGKSLQGAKNATKVWSAEMKANMKIADLAGNKMGVLDAKQQGLTKTIQAQQQVVEQLSKSYKGSFVDGQPTEQTAKLAAQLQNANGQLANYQTQLINTVGDMAQLKIETEGFTGRMNTFGQTLTSTGEKMSNIGGKMTVGLTAPIVAGVGLAVKAAIDFESAFAGTKKTVDELVDSNGKVIISYDDLSQGIRNMSKELPASASEIAAVAEAAGQLGIKTENVLSFSKVMIDLGESTNMGAETAATALARLANITQMPQDQFTNLGSSLVELGNNFATTESEITEMALRLAGAGSQVGMSEADILGLSAALSSVGIEAEMGGSAISKSIINMSVASKMGLDKVRELEQATGMTRRELELMQNLDGKSFKEIAASMSMTTTELNKIIKSGKNLEGFSAVAGMTGEQFKQAFEKDAVGALGAFINGLGTAQEKGTSAIELLDELGISEVRLRDSLLRAGNASELFAGAVDMSNKAWGENTALTDEANKRYETTESKLKMLKNQVNDVAIEFGGPFVDALREGVTAATPLIKSAGDLAKSFSNANPETKKLITNLILGTDAAGPFLKITGSLTKGIGGLTTNTVGMLGVMAKKKTIADFSQQLLTGSSDIIKWEGASKTAKTATDLLGGAAGANSMKLIGFKTAASSAAGANGVGAMTSSLITLNPWVVGIGATLAIGYGAWKLWGEEAWNSGQRTARWGTDVGEATDKALTSVQGYNQKASGEFSLVEQGLSDNTESMVANFQKMGQSIENDLTQQIDAFRESVKLMPEEVRSAAEKIVQEALDKREKVLATVEANNQRVEEIRKRATDNNRQSTIEEGKMISDLMKQSASDYSSIFAKTTEEHKMFVDALTGNIEDSSKEQATAWLQSLGKQRSDMKSDYTNKLNDFKEYLKEKGLLDTIEGDQLVKLFEKARDESTNAIDQQSEIILSKYPDLIDKVLISNGQLASGMGEYARGVEKSNNDILNNVEDMSSVIAESAEKNAKKLGLMGKESTEAGKKWNGIVLDPKTGTVKTNAQEELNKATKSSKEWESIAFKAKEANLTTNAKLMLAEAAIANGHWYSLKWEEREALVDSNSTITAMKALQDQGVWNNLNFEQQKAILYSDTPEKVAQAVSDIGLWNELSPAIKELKASNYDFLNSLNESEQTLKDFNTTNPELKTLLINGDEKINAIDAQKALDQFNKLPEKQKVLVMQNGEYMQRLQSAQNALNTYNRTDTSDKHLHATAEYGEVVSAKAAIDGIPNETTKWIKLAVNDMATKTLVNSGNVAMREHGTNFHSGGDMIVNDQKGPLYKELVEFPGKIPFIPEGRNVYIPDAPRGTKVWTASQTKNKIPHYANGVGIPENSKLMQSINRVSDVIGGDTSIVINNTDGPKLDTMISILQKLLIEFTNFDARTEINFKGLSREVEKDLTRRNRR